MNASISQLHPGSRTAAKIDVEERDDLLAKRGRLVQEIEERRASAAPRLQVFLQAAAAARAHREKCEGEFKAAQIAELEAAQDLQRCDYGLQITVAGLERGLRETAPARIDEAIAKWSAAWDLARGVTGPIASINAKLTDAELRAARQIPERCAALLAAMRSGHELKLEALTPVELEQRIAAIDADIPPLN